MQNICYDLPTNESHIDTIELESIINNGRNKHKKMKISISEFEIIEDDEHQA